MTSSLELEQARTYRGHIGTDFDAFSFSFESFLIGRNGNDTQQLRIDLFIGGIVRWGRYLEVV